MYQQASAVQLMKPILLLTIVITLIYKLLNFGKPRSFNIQNIPIIYTLTLLSVYVQVKPQPLHCRQEPCLVRSRFKDRKHPAPDLHPSTKPWMEEGASSHTSAEWSSWQPTRRTARRFDANSLRYCFLEVNFRLS